MKKLTIGIAGAPIVGKSSLLEEIAKIQKCEVDHIFLEKGNLKHLNVFLQEYEISIYTIPGPVFYMYEMYKYLMSMSDLIVYVFHMEMVLPYDEEDELMYFEYYERVARQENKLWTNIPWLFVLNKIISIKESDYRIFSLPNQIPSNLRDNVICTDIYRGIGANLVWEKILDLTKFS